MVERKAITILGKIEPVDTYSKVWLTEKQVVLLVGLSLSTLQKYRHKRKGIRYVKIGRSVRYALSDVIEYMDSHKIEFIA